MTFDVVWHGASWRQDTPTIQPPAARTFVLQERRKPGRHSRCPGLVLQALADGPMEVGQLAIVTEIPRRSLDTLLWRMRREGLVERQAQRWPAVYGLRDRVSA